MDVIGVNSKSVVHRFFQKMVEIGYLEKKQWIYYPSQKLVSLPLFESVRAWIPDVATDENADQVNIESYLIDHPVTTVLLTVQWDSMVDAGMQEWDILVVDKSREPKRWDIVIAVVDNEYTVKYLQKNTNGRWYLKPWNENYEDIYPEEELEIFGVVTGSFRRY